MRLLIVEDEVKIADFVRKGLGEAGFSVDVAHDGEKGFELATSRDYDALVLDIMLPKRDGLSILRDLRRRADSVPVVLLTARGELDDRLAGLDLGADDYLTKPFFIEELTARIHAVIRRSRGDASSVLRAEELVVDLLAREARVAGELVELTSREFNLLAYLMRSPGRVFTRTQILEHVWDYFFDPATNLVDVYIQRLRKKLDPDDRERFIETVRGVGYRFRRG